MTNYQSSSAAASLPNSYYNYQPNSNYHGRQPLPDPVPRDNKLLDDLVLWGMYVLSLILLCTLAFLFYYYEDKRPDFQLDSFSVSNFTFTNGSRVFMISEVQLTARTPNFKYCLGYDHVETSIYYKHQLLFQTFLPPFSQGKKHKTSLVAKFAGDGNVVDKWVVDGINGEIAREGSVEFNFWFISSIVRGNSSLGSDIGYTLKVLCRDLVVEIPTDGSRGRLTGEPKTCEVEKEIDDDDNLSG